MLLTLEDKSVRFANEWATKFLEEQCYVNPSRRGAESNYTYKSSQCKNDRLQRYDLKRNVFFQTRSNAEQRNDQRQNFDDDD